jgi:hypothetical protein
MNSSTSGGRAVKFAMAKCQKHKDAAYPPPSGAGLSPQRSADNATATETQEWGTAISEQQANFRFTESHSFPSF